VKELVMKMRRAALALIALLIPGCSREPTLQWVLDGKVELPAAEREALEIVFGDTRASQVDLSSEGGLLGGVRGVGFRVAGDHVTGLAIRGEQSFEALTSFSKLRRLVLHRPGLSSLEGLGSLPLLEELLVDPSSLETLKGIDFCCPNLQTLAIGHGLIEDLSPLQPLQQLRSLRLHRHDLTSLKSAPEIPALRELFLDGGSLESLAGLEAFSGLEKLQLFGAKQLTDLADLPTLPHLKEMELFQNGLISLTSLPSLPALERIETSDNRILSVQLGDPSSMPALQELEMHEKDLLSVELGVLPRLETLNLEGEGSHFKEGGRLRRLNIASQPALEQLNLRRNHLQSLPGLAPQPALRRIQLDHNPFDDLDHFREGYPSLSSISIRKSRVQQIPPFLSKAGVVSHNPSEIEANQWEGVLREAFEAVESSFVEDLPKLGGSAREHASRCSIETSTFSTPRLNCSGSIEAVSGMVYLPLVQVDPLLPGKGRSNFPIRATIRTRTGRARIYLKYELNIRGQAEALAGYQDPEAPLFQIGDRHGPEDFKKGYVFAEAQPGKPGATSGEAHLLVDQLVVWVEGFDGAEEIEYVLEAPYR